MVDVNNFLFDLKRRKIGNRTIEHIQHIGNDFDYTKAFILFVKTYA